MGDSGVMSESWVWRESVEGDGSRSGQLEDAWYVVSSFWIGPSCGPPHDGMLLIAEQHRG